MLTPAEREIVRARLRTYPKGVANGSWGFGPMAHTSPRIEAYQVDSLREFG